MWQRSGRTEPSIHVTAEWRWMINRMMITARRGKCAVRIIYDLWDYEKYISSMWILCVYFDVWLYYSSIARLPFAHMNLSLLLDLCEQGGAFAQPTAEKPLFSQHATKPFISNKVFWAIGYQSSPILFKRKWHTHTVAYARADIRALAKAHQTNG